MRPVRKHIAIAIDGGGLRGIIETRALMALEKGLGVPLRQAVGLAAGTSTGSIISAGLAAGVSVRQLDALYLELGAAVFCKSWRSTLFPITRHRYSPSPLQAALDAVLDGRRLGDLWARPDPVDLVVTTFDLQTNHTRFLKPWKKEYRDWPLSQAVLASSSVPTYFPPVQGRFVDGGVGAYSNPCYLAAYEARYCLGWDPAETTLISLGAGRDPHHFTSEMGNALRPWQWITPVLGAFLNSADEQQTHLVRTFFDALDFRRFQVDLPRPIQMDAADQIDALIAAGEEMGQKILLDEWEQIDPACPKQIEPNS